MWCARRVPEADLPLKTRLSHQRLAAVWLTVSPRPPYWISVPGGVVIDCCSPIKDAVVFESDAKIKYCC
jgi:hypothetical protein